MTRRDTVGVVVALLALALIGVSGYIWLNPGLSYRDVTGRLARSPAPGVSVPVESPHDALVAAAPDERVRCPFCGMYTDMSPAEAVISWGDGSHSHFDSWDCVFAYEAESGLMLDFGQVREHGHALDEPEWLDVAKASYLYDTNEIQGSMPPYVAAFGEAALAESARDELGGELVDFAGLRSKWQ